MREFNRIIFGKNFGFAKEWDKSQRKWTIEFTEEELNLFIDRLESPTVQKGNFEPCGKQASFFDEVLNMKIDYMCGGEDGLCKECQKKYDSSNLKNQPKYATALSGGNAENDDLSLGSRYDPKKADTYNLNRTSEVKNG